LQIAFLLLFGVSLVFFSLTVSAGVEAARFVVGGERVPLPILVRMAAWGALFLASFLGTGFFLYERERDEGRIARRLPFYEWVIQRRRRPTDADGPARPIRRAPAATAEPHSVDRPSNDH
jgi:hypothetical protein